MHASHSLEEGLCSTVYCTQQKSKANELGIQTVELFIAGFSNLASSSLD